MSSQILIAVDLDGTLYDAVGSVLQYLKDAHGVYMRRGDVTTMNLAEFTPDREVNGFLLNLLRDSEFYANMKPFDYAWGAVSLLNELGPVIAMTKRDPKVKAATRIALTRDFGPMIRDVSFAENGPQEAKRKHVSYMFEDNQQRALAYARRQITTYAIGGSTLSYHSNFYRPTQNILTGARELKKAREGWE